MNGIVLDTIMMIVGALLCAIVGTIGLAVSLALAC